MAKIPTERAGETMNLESWEPALPLFNICFPSQPSGPSGPQDRIVGLPQDGPGTSAPLSPLPKCNGRAFLSYLSLFSSEEFPAPTSVLLPGEMTPPKIRSTCH